MREDISIWISQCEICGANKPPNKSSKAPLGSMPMEAPLDRMGTDLLGPLPLAIAFRIHWTSSSFPYF
jgi:hypothetical protein